MSNKLTKETILERLMVRNNKVSKSKHIQLFPLDQLYVNQNAPLQFKCSNNHTWIGTAGRIFVKSGCPECKIAQDSINKRTPFSQMLTKANDIHNN